MSSREKLARKYLYSLRKSLDKGGVEACFKSLKEYDLLASTVYQLRTVTKKNKELSDNFDLEDSLSRFGQEIVSLAQQKVQRDQHRSFSFEYSKIWKRNFPLFLITTIVFLSGGILGLGIGFRHQDYVQLIIGQEMSETIMDNRAWFESINENNFMNGLAIAKNNIMVSINTYALGVALGLGGLAMVFYNALLLGVIFGFCKANDFEASLFGFVLGHGPLEITIIIAAGFSSLLVGRVFYMRPYSVFKLRMSQGAKDSLTLLMGILPWLLIAGAIEGFISPQPNISFENKFYLGLLAAFIFWAWTFFPYPKKS